MEKLSWTHVGGDASEAVAGSVRALTVTDIGVAFQPIVDLKTGLTFAHEALVRCKKPEYAVPSVLFEHAVEESACGRLGRLIREVAFETCGDVPLFVNLHPEELNSRWLVRPDDPLCFHAAPVYLEVTESAAFTHFELCRNVLKELCRRTGAILVVDDFGAGYSNLQRVVDLEPAIVKLDLALIRDIHRQPRKQTVVRHMANLCKELNARVVAEGIEALDELKCVRDLGVDFAQGYLLARPAAIPPKAVWPFGSVSLPRPVAARVPVAAAAPPAARPPLVLRPPKKPSKRPARVPSNGARLGSPKPKRTPVE